MMLDNYEKRKVEDRTFQHWHRQRANGAIGAEWKDYWKVNKKQCLKNAVTFKGMLNELNFDRYLSDHECNAWSLWNMQTMNG